MNISKYSKYLVINRINNKFKAISVDGDKLANVISSDTIEIDEINQYEIYTCCPETGVTGWDIKYIESTDRLIKYYPNFDCIITKNDCAGHVTEDFLQTGFDTYLYG